MQELAQLVGQLSQANLAYQLGRPIISDLEYDVLWARLRELDPTNPALYPKVLPSQKGPIVQHTKPCLSLNKAMKGEELLPFLVRFKGQVVTLEPKYDGVFLRLYQIDSSVRAVLSGDGTTGRDITEILSPILPPSLPAASLDCEVVIPNNRWDPSMGSNQRNVVAGLLNRDRLSLEELQPLWLIPHHGGKRPHHESHVINSFDIPLWENRCFNYYLRHKEEFPLDGVVLKILDPEVQQVTGSTHEYPNWAIAWKPPIQTALTRVTDVQWNVTRSQRLVPTIVFDPIALCGTLNTRATGNNASWIFEKGIAPGALIQVGKAGEIIPKILEVRDGVTPDLLTECPICGAALKWRGVDLVCPGEQCLGAHINRCEFFYSNAGLPIKGVSHSFFDKILGDPILREAFRERPWLLFLMNPLHVLWENLSEIVGPEKMLRLVRSAHATMEQDLYTHANFITALGLPGVGWKSAMAWLLSQSNIGLKRSTKTLETNRIILENLPLILRGLQELSWLRPVSGEVSRTFALTGTFSIPRNEIVLMFQKLNWVYDDPILKTTNFLYCSRDSFGSSQKWEAAQKWGIPILGERDLLKELSPLIKEKPFNDFIPGA